MVKSKKRVVMHEDDPVSDDEGLDDEKSRRFGRQRRRRDS